MDFLIDNFKHLTTSPVNVEQLKKLVLQMAVQGKLTAKWRDDNQNVEPASLLLEKIKAEREILYREKKISKQFINISNTKNEAQNISFSWLSTKLGILADIVRGGSPRPAGSNEFYNGKIPFLKVADITKNTEKYLNDYQFTIKEAGLKKTRFVKENTLLLTNSGATLGVPKICKFPTTFNDGIQAFLQLSSFVDKEFLFYFLYSITDELRRITAGGGQPNLNTDISKNINILLPPLLEQKTIVSQIESLFTQIDQLHALAQKHLKYREKSAKALFSKINHAVNDTELQETWQTLTAHFHTLTQSKESVKQLRQSILQMIVQGKLTAKWRKKNPDVEPASVLLEKIKVKKEQLIKDGEIKRQKTLQPVSDDERPFKMPRNWIYTRLGEVSFVRGGKRVPIGHSLSETKTPHIYIRIRDMKNGSIQSSGNVFLKEETHIKIKKYTISKDDLYITIAGTIGQIGIVPEKFNNMNLTENAAKISVFCIDKFYLKTVLESKFCQDQFFLSTKGMAQPKLALKRIENSIILLPPLEEQKYIVLKIKQLMAWCDELEKKIEKRDAYQEKMMQSVVKQVFKTEKELTN